MRLAGRSPRRRVELHFHLLPGVDDGPATTEEALELATAAAGDGTGTVVATPHVHDVQVAELPARVAELRRALSAAGVPVAVECGGELDHDDVPALSDGELDLVAQGPAGRRWLLLEAPLQGSARPLPAAIRELWRRGFGVLLAHPERSPGLLGPDEGLDLEREVARGLPIQVNAHSLTGAHGAQAERVAMALVRAGMVAAVASDAHRLPRGPALGAASEAMRAARVDPSLRREVVESGPRRLLEEGTPPLAG